MTCCQQLDGASDSPFELLTLGFYDGPTAGLVRCRVCALAYHFEMLTWDRHREVRIYGLTPIHEVDFMRVGKLIEQAGTGANADRELLVGVRDALASGLVRELIVAAEDLSLRVLSVTRMDYSRWAEVLRLGSD
jgi:hypothetical protein